MINKILAKSCTILTAKAIRDYIVEKTQKRYPIVFEGGNINCLLRIGNSAPVFGTDSKLNDPEIIRLVSSKLEFSKKFADIIPTPQFKREFPDKFPVLIRETLTGYGGVGIDKIKTPEEFNKVWKPYFYWTPFIKTTNEFRVHVVGGNPVKIMKKIKMDNDIDDMPIRNLSNNYSFKKVNDFSGFKKMLDIVQKIVDVLGKRSWYGIDLAFSPEHDTYFVFEVNSSPSLKENPNTLQLYMDYIMKEVFNV